MAVTIGSVTEGNANAEEIKNNSPDSELYENNKKYLQGSLVKFNDKIYLAKRNVPSDVDLDNPYYWEIFMDAADSKRVDELFEKTGNLDELETESKDNLVAAVNELAECQADYGQNDSTAKDYIKNRICYKEEIKEEVYSNSSLNVTAAGYQSDITVASLGTDANIIYKIIWDGTEYTCTCNTHLYYGRHWYWYGNANLGAPYNEFGSATDEPFMITDNGGLYTDQVGSHSLVIKSISTVYHTLDPNYLAEVESALSDNSKRILNTAYGDFVLKNNKVFVSSQETVEAKKINDKYYRPFNFYGYDHSIYVVITPEGTNYFNKIGSLKLEFKQRDQSTLAIMPKLLSGREVTADDLPNDVAVFGRGFSNNEIYLLNPKKPILDAITGQVTADKITNPDNSTDLVQYGAFQAAVPMIQMLNISDAKAGQLAKIKAVNNSGNPIEWEAVDISSATDLSLGLTSASVGQIIKVKAVDESGKPTEWESADMPSGGGSNGGIHLIARVVTEANAASIEVTGLSTTAEVLSLRIYNPGSTCGGGLCITVNGIRKDGFGGTNQGTSTVQAFVRAWLYRDGGTLYGRSRMANEGTNVYEWPEMGEITSITVDSRYNDGTTKYFQAGTIFEIYEGMYPNVQ